MSSSILVTDCRNERNLRFYLCLWTFWGGNSIFYNAFLPTWASKVLHSHRSDTPQKSACYLVTKTCIWSFMPTGTLSYLSSNPSNEKAVTHLHENRNLGRHQSLCNLLFHPPPTCLTALGLQTASATTSQEMYVSSANHRSWFEWLRRERCWRVHGGQDKT